MDGWLARVAKMLGRTNKTRKPTAATTGTTTTTGNVVAICLMSIFPCLFAIPFLSLSLAGLFAHCVYAM